MNEFMITLLSLSFSGAVLILLLFLLKLLVKHKFSKSWQYYIWLAAALRFLLPFTPETTLSGFLFGTVQNIITADSGSRPSGDVVWSSSGDGIWSGIWNGAGTDSGILKKTGTNSTAPARTASTPASLSTYLMFIWSAVALALIMPVKQSRMTIFHSSPS